MSYRITWDRKGMPKVVEGKSFVTNHLLDNIVYITRPQAEYAMSKRYELIVEIHGGMADKPLQLIYQNVIKL
jgi:hypothetical protein